jgi:hypothetical protein
MDMAKMLKAEFCMPQYRQHNTRTRYIAPKSRMSSSRKTSSLGTNRWWLRYKDTQLWFIKTTPMHMVIVQMEVVRFVKPNGGGTTPVQLQPPDIQSLFQTQHSCRTECLQHHPETLCKPNGPISNICNPAIYVHIVLFPVLILPSWCICPG